MIGIFAAMGMEVAGVRKRLTVEESVCEKRCSIERGLCAGVEVLLVRTGMGKDRALAAADILPRFPLDAVVSLGFGGALVPGLRAGDVVVCKSVRHGDDEAVRCDPTLLSRATALSSRIAVVEGTGATSDAFVPGDEAKRTLASELDATVVDMESYWIGAAATTRGIPFLSLRAVSDPLAARLPPIDRFVDADGRMRWRSMIACCLRRPRTIVDLLSLARDSRRAAASLAAYTINLLPALAGVQVQPEPARRMVGEIR